MLTSFYQTFEHQSRTIIGLERLMLEASSFDFRNRHPQHLLVKLAKCYGHERHSAIAKTAYLISIDLYRTFAPLKQSTPTMAFACLELAGRLHGQEVDAIADGRDYTRWGIERAMVMGTVPHKQATALLLYKHIPLDTSTHKTRNISSNIHIMIRDVTNIMLITMVVNRDPPRPLRPLHPLPHVDECRPAIRDRCLPRNTHPTQRRIEHETHATIHRVPPPERAR